MSSAGFCLVNVDEYYIEWQGKRGKRMEVFKHAGERIKNFKDSKTDVEGVGKRTFEAFQL